ncbi:hypothetical protein Cni_G25331 [Canna indica]|uniref:SPARK domain-containing protein n=1 Tax=Canna indica TaxID=4628 RepID=A0AAQ3QMB7_9LILI|nr:hypothetical protein Cni_G25331 [Canna indica]
MDFNTFKEDNFIKDHATPGNHPALEHDHLWKQSSSAHYEGIGPESKGRMPAQPLSHRHLLPALTPSSLAVLSRPRLRLLSTSASSPVVRVFALSVQPLHDTVYFRLPDANTSAACLCDFLAKLSVAPFSLSPTASTLTNSPSPPTSALGIFTTRDWVASVGNSIALNTVCDGDLSNFARCDVCVKVGFNVSSTLTAIDDNTSSAKPCFYLTIVYAAGVVNHFRPQGLPRPTTLTPQASSSVSSAPSPSSSSTSPSASSCGKLGSKRRGVTHRFQRGARGRTQGPIPDRSERLSCFKILTLNALRMVRIRCNANSIGTLRDHPLTPFSKYQRSTKAPTESILNVRD